MKAIDHIRERSLPRLTDEQLSNVLNMIEEEDSHFYILDPKRREFFTEMILIEYLRRPRRSREIKITDLPQHTNAREILHVLDVYAEPAILSI